MESWTSHDPAIGFQFACFLALSLALLLLDLRESPSREGVRVGSRGLETLHRNVIDPDNS